MPHAQARLAADYLLRIWSRLGAEIMVVGSVRRQRADVGDLEFVAEWRKPGDDPLHECLEAMSGRPESLFAAEHPGLPPITVVRGVKPGFLDAAFVVHLVDKGTDKPYDIPVQIYRFREGQRGWKIVMRTGPSDFGQWFLWRWKAAMGIPANGLASSGGYLLDRAGQPQHIDTEQEAFRLCRVAWVNPDHRDAFIANMKGGFR